MTPLRLLYSARLFPNIFVCSNPFKILEYRHLVGLTPFSGTELVLDLGCGSGLQTCCLSRNAGKVVGLDICDLTKAEEKARRIRGRFEVEFIRSRLQEAPFPDGTFDRIFSFSVVEHMPDHREVLRKCHDLLKPSGELILSTDCLAGIPPELKAKHQADHGVNRYFTAQELRQLLEDTSFRDIDVHPLFTSSIAGGLFRQGIRTHFTYTFGKTVWQYLLLYLAEALSHRKKTRIFLAVHCHK